MRKKKLMSMLLAAAMILASAVPSYAGEKSISKTIQTSENGIDTSVSTRSEAKTLYDEAVAADNAASEKETAAQMAYDTATSSYTEAQNAVKAAEENVNKKDVEASNAFAQAKTDADTNVTTLTSEVEAAKKEKENIEKKVAEKKSLYESNKVAIEAAQAAYNEAVAAAEAAKQKVNDGSFAFFEEMGSTAALDALNNAKYASSTHKGVETDATSLENMKKALSILPEYEELRVTREDGFYDYWTTNSEYYAEEYKNYYHETQYVSDQMVAKAQSNANASALTQNHTSQFNVGENLAFGYYDKSPFDGWYRKELKGFKQFVNGEKVTYGYGHFLNIKDIYCYSTGIAYNSAISTVGYASYKSTWSQTFGDPYRNGYNFAKDPNYFTVDEYINRFTEYYNRVTAAVTETASAVDAAKRTLDSLPITEDDLKSAEETLETATNTLNEKEKALAEAQTLAQKAAALSYEDAVTNPITDEAFTYLNDYVKAVADAKDALKETKKDFETKEGTLKEALKEAEDALIEARSEHEKTSSALKEAKSIYDTFFPDKAAAVLLSGNNRFKTAVKVAEKAFPEGASKVIIAYAKDFPDALAATALAGALDCPILISNRDTLNEDIANLLDKWGNPEVILVGGLWKCKDEINKHAHISMELSDNNRYGTAEAIVSYGLEEGLFDTNEVIVATGIASADALSMSSWAYKYKMPILLADKDGGFTEDTSSLISQFDKVYVAGADSRVKTTALQELGYSEEIGNMKRLWGHNRYETSSAIAEYFIQEYDDVTADVDGTCFAVGNDENFPDSLVGGVLAGKSGAPMILVSTYKGHKTFDTTKTLIKSGKPETVYLLGAVRLNGVDKLVKEALGIN